MFDPKKWTIRKGSEEGTDNQRPTQLSRYAARQHDKHGRLKAPKCSVCNLLMRIIRRQAHPTRGPRYELQTFICPNCGHRSEATVASLGGS
jgi:hypothetical protein